MGNFKNSERKLILIGEIPESFSSLPQIVNYLLSEIRSYLFEIQF